MTTPKIKRNLRLKSRAPVLPGRLAWQITDACLHSGWLWPEGFFVKRRMFLTMGLTGMMSGRAAFAKSFTDSVVDQLRDLGFDDISIERTMLGRTRILAQGRDGTREIILNPRTGEILRDLWIARSETGSGGLGLIQDSDSGKGRRRRRRSDFASDDDGDDSNSGKDRYDD
jgi:hypothetical protein